MMELVNWWMLMCCWGCDRKSEDEREYEASRRQRKREYEMKNGNKEDAVVADQPVKSARLAHAPVLES